MARGGGRVAGGGRRCWSASARDGAAPRAAGCRRSPRAALTWNWVRNRLPRQVGRREVGGPQVGSDQVGQPQVGAAQVGADQVGAAQVRAAQVGPADRARSGRARAGRSRAGRSAQRAPRRLVPPRVDRRRAPTSVRRTRPGPARCSRRSSGADPSPQRRHVHRGQLGRAAVAQPLDLGRGPRAAPRAAGGPPPARAPRPGTRAARAADAARRTRRTSTRPAPATAASPGRRT